MSLTIPPLIPVASSAINRIGYDAAAQRLYVEFPSRSLWTYSPVPAQEYLNLQAAESVGKHFATHIRGKYMGEAMPSERSGVTEGTEP